MVAEKTRLRRLISLGYGRDVNVSVIGRHTSGSIPLISAKDDTSPVEVTTLGDNLETNYLGVNLRAPIPATFLYPISGGFGPIFSHSGHERSDLAPEVSNFKKYYHNRKPMQRFGLSLGRGLEAAFVIGYLDLVSGLPQRKIFKIVMDKTLHGKVDFIDGNWIDHDELAKVVDLPIEKINAYDIDVKDETGLFSKIHLDTFDHEYGGSTVHLEVANGKRLPGLTVPYNHVMIATTEEMQKLGLEKRVPANAMKYRDDHFNERRKMVDQKMVANQVQRAPFLTREFAINTPNCLDATLVALYLSKVVAPIVKRAEETKYKVE